MAILNASSQRTALIGADWRRALCLTAMALHRVGDEQTEFVALDEHDQRSLLDYAATQLIEPHVARALSDAHGDAHFATQERCNDVLQASQQRIDILCDQLDVVAEAFDDRPVVALKNAGIARALHADRATCPMGDIDVLIRPGDFMECHDRLLTLGYELGSRSELYAADLDDVLDSGGAEYRREVDGETVWLELQWRPVAGRWISKQQEPSADDLLDRSVPVSGSMVRLLAPVDNLMQVCLHTAKHSFVRDPGLRLHTDVDRLVAYAPPDWEQFVADARQMHTTDVAYFSLALAHVLLQTPIPSTVLDELAPPRWKQTAMWRWFERIDVFDPQARKFSRPEMIGFHAMLFDTPTDLVAAGLGTVPSELTVRNAPSLLRQGSARVRDLVTRYER